jgi:hypothetical protein
MGPVGQLRSARFKEMLAYNSAIEVMLYFLLVCFILDQELGILVAVSRVVNLPSARGPHAYYPGLTSFSSGVIFCHLAAISFKISLYENSG